MIRVNLSGTSKKPVVKAPKATGGAPTAVSPLVHLMILVAAAVGGYVWYASLTAEASELTTRIGALQEEQKKLDVIIKQDQVYEARKAALESRIRVVEDLRKNQLSPIVVLDALADAIDRTQYVWLSSLSQKDTTFSMAGTGSSVIALTDFLTNLKATGFFPNPNLSRFEDSKGNYTFTMQAEFTPPTPSSPAQPKEKGAN